MSLRKQWRIVLRSLARYIIYGLAWLFGVLPFGVMRPISRGILFCLFPFLRRHRRIAEESLALAFGGEKSFAEQKRILWDCYTNIVDNGGEILRYYLYHAEPLKSVMEFFGREYLDEALAQGRGVLAVTAHYGNFPLMALYLALLGYPVSVIVRPLRDPKAGRFFYQKGIAGRFETIDSMPRRKCVSRVLQALKENRVVFLLADQNFGSDGVVYVNFFDRPAATAPGPVIFAQRSGAVILPVFTYREGQNRHRVEFQEPFVLRQAGEQSETLQRNMQELTKMIEAEIRKRPREWAWMHRRWKTQPVLGR